jgi:hypothetical protein
MLSDEIVLFDTTDLALNRIIEDIRIGTDVEDTPFSRYFNATLGNALIYPMSPVNHSSVRRRLLFDDDNYFSSDDNEDDDADTEIYSDEDDDPFQHISAIITIKINNVILTEENKNSFCSDNCAICLNVFMKKESVSLTCNHEFCSGCFEDWRNVREFRVSCPTCRAHVSSITRYS